MSFKCQFCKKVQPNGTPSTLVCTETHEVEQRPFVDREGEVVVKRTTEIKVEKLACPKCAGKVIPAPQVQKLIKLSQDSEVTFIQRFSSE